MFDSSNLYDRKQIDKSKWDKVLKTRPGFFLKNGTSSLFTNLQLMVYMHNIADF